MKRTPRQPIRFTAPRAPGGLCWACDKRLHAGGRSYVEVEVDGIKRPVHRICAEEMERQAR